MSLIFKDKKLNNYKTKFNIFSYTLLIKSLRTLSFISC